MNAPTISYPTVQNALQTISDAVEDTHNALGDQNVLAKVSDYKNLVPDLMQMAGQTDLFPAGVGDVPTAHIEAMAADVAAQHGISQLNAVRAVTDAISMFSQLVTTVLHTSESIAGLFKR